MGSYLCSNVPFDAVSIQYRENLLGIETDPGAREVLIPEWSQIS
jgi:hypothetical protein